MGVWIFRVAVTHTGTPWALKRGTVSKCNLTIDTAQNAPGKPGHIVPVTMSAT